VNHEPVNEGQQVNRERVQPYVISSAAVSLDGYLDDSSERRLMLSGPADLDRVDAVRAGVDAILVGANTIRRDDPALLIRSPERRRARLDAGRTEHPVRVTLTDGGDLPATARFFGPGQALVYAPATVAAALSGRLPATVVPGTDLPSVLADLAGRGVGRLMVEGGGQVHTAFLTAGLVDELHVAVAPLFVGDADAPRFLLPGAYPGGRLRLAEVRRLDDVVLLRYLLGGCTDG